MQAILVFDADDCDCGNTGGTGNRFQIEKAGSDAS
jgi:hypothetical protein